MKRVEALNDKGLELLYKVELTERAITKILNKITQQRFRITAEQNFVLHVLENRGNTTIEELAHLLLRELSTVSSLISRMEKRGLVKKIKKEGGRAFSIEMTAKTKKNWSSTVVQHKIRDLVSVLSEEEYNILDTHISKLLNKAIEDLEEYYRSPFKLDKQV
jgi:DNA-binding MarR family transcriptional regulator